MDLNRFDKFVQDYEAICRGKSRAEIEKLMQGQWALHEIVTEVSELGSDIKKPKIGLMSSELHPKKEKG